MSANFEDRVLNIEHSSTLTILHFDEVLDVFRENNRHISL